MSDRLYRYTGVDLDALAFADSDSERLDIVLDALEPVDLRVKCEACGMPLGSCQPGWASGHQCCPHCSHGLDWLEAEDEQ